MSVVYVDDMRAPFGRMLMCHMHADTHDELVAMADRIGVAQRWIQHRGSPYEHFDISLSKRALAIHHGAKAVTMRQLTIIRHALSAQAAEPKEPTPGARAGEGGARE